MLWSHTLPLYEEILAHPFNQELARGTLSQARFHFYLAQDALYLRDFSRALAFIAARSHTSSHIRHFLQFAQEALVAERELHAHFLGDLCCDETPSHACLAYTHYLIATTATAPLEEAIAAVLPCIWIYREVGRAIAAQNRADHPYKLWIDAYSSEEFSRATDVAIALCDEVAARVTHNQRIRMQTAFAECAQWEWHFWNDAYQMLRFSSKAPVYSLI